MTLTVQQIQYTTDPGAWHDLAHGLGLEPLPGADATWSEFAGNGILAVHRVDRDADERTEIVLLTDTTAELDGLESVLRRVGATVHRTTLDGVGPLLVVDAPLALTVTTTQHRVTSTGVLTAMPLWYDTDTLAAAEVVEAVGLRRRLSSDSGVWTDFTASGGGALALHRDDERRGVELSFEYPGDLDALAARLSERGFTARIIDESYNRTLRVARPDGPDLWVNGVQDDLYGYSRSD